MRRVGPRRSHPFWRRDVAHGRVALGVYPNKRRSAPALGTLLPRYIRGQTQRPVPSCWSQGLRASRRDRMARIAAPDAAATIK